MSAPPGYRESAKPKRQRSERSDAPYRSMLAPVFEWFTRRVLLPVGVVGGVALVAAYVDSSGESVRLRGRVAEVTTARRPVDSHVGTEHRVTTMFRVTTSEGDVWWEGYATVGDAAVVEGSLGRFTGWLYASEVTVVPE